MSLREVFLGTFSDMVQVSETVATVPVQPVTPSGNHGRQQRDLATQPPASVKRKMIRRITGAAIP